MMIQARGFDFPPQLAYHANSVDSVTAGVKLGADRLAPGILDMGNINTAVRRFLSEAGWDVEALDCGAVLNDFHAEMKAGLAGKPSSLAMLPSYISMGRDVPSNEPVIALDAGGTHLRSALLMFDAKGKARITEYSRHKMPGYAEELSRENFYSRFVEILKPLAGQAKRVGLCFSYPARISPECDGRLLTWTKEIKVPELVGDYIGRNIADRLKARGYSLQFTLVNDTVATLLAGRSAEIGERKYSSYVGLVLGTGTNIAYVEKNRNIGKQPHLDPGGTQAVNVESGNFARAPRSAFDDDLDAATSNPGNYRFEKMISGAYLGRLGLLLLRSAAEAGLLSEAAGSGICSLPRLSTPQLSFYLKSSQGKGPWAGLSLTDTDREVIRRLLEAVVLRAAALTAINMAAAVLESGGGRSPLKPVLVSIEGSAYYQTWGLRQETERCLKGLLEPRCVCAELVRIRRSSLLGAAVAALTAGPDVE